jgi:toxin ParE1/3/4
MDYISVDSPKAAIQMDKLFSDAATTLATFPMRGREGRVAGTRELLPHESYRLIYEIEGGTVWVLALVHTSRQWPPVSE